MIRGYSLIASLLLAAAAVRPLLAQQIQSSSDDPSCQMRAVRLGTLGREPVGSGGALVSATGTLVTGGTGLVEFSTREPGITLIEADLSAPSQGPDIEVVRCEQSLTRRGVLAMISGDRSAYPRRLDRNFSRLGNSRSRVAISLPQPGDYRIVVGGAPAGTAFTVKLSRKSVTAPTIGSIAFGAAITGAVGNGGSTEIVGERSYILYALDVTEPNDYLFQASGAEDLILEVGYLNNDPVWDYFGRRAPSALGSTTSVSKLQFVDPAFNRLAEAVRKASQDTTDIRPRWRMILSSTATQFGLRLEPDKYVVRLRSTRMGATGSYRFSVRALDPKSDWAIPNPQNIALGQKVVSSLMMSDMLDWNITGAGWKSRFAPVRIFSFVGEKGKSYEARMMSSAIDSLLTVGAMTTAVSINGLNLPHTEAGETFVGIFTNDDSPDVVDLGDKDACIFFRAGRPGPIALKASTARLNQSGGMQLIVKEADTGCIAKKATDADKPM